MSSKDDVNYKVNVGGLGDDALQETAVQYASKLSEKGAKALRGAANDTRALAAAAADRAAHFKSMLANLDTLNTSVYKQLSSLESSKLSVQVQAIAESYRRDIGKAEGLFKTALQGQNASAALSAFGKNLGGLISAIGFISTVTDPKATEFSVGRDLAALGGSILAAGAIGLAGVGSAPGWVPAAAIAITTAGASWLGKEAWHLYANAIGWDEKTSPAFHDTMRGTYNTIRNAFGFSVSADGKGDVPIGLRNRLLSDFTGVSAVTWPDGTRVGLKSSPLDVLSEVTFRKDGGYTKVTRLPDGTTGHHTVDAGGTITRFQPMLPEGIRLGPNQFYVDAAANNLNTISEITGVSTSALMGLNPGLGLTSGSQPISVGQTVNLPAPTNLINIEITSDPKPQRGSIGENRAGARDVITRRRLLAVAFELVRHRRGCTPRHPRAHCRTHAFCIFNQNYRAVLRTQKQVVCQLDTLSHPKCCA